MRHYNIIVWGKVQGVFYRQSAQERARQLDIKGFVQNKPNGSVYIEAEGREEALQDFVAWCKRGPASAVVSCVEVTESEIKGFLDFTIER